jgi:putative sugar O-methyltransferase
MRSLTSLKAAFDHCAQYLAALEAAGSSDRMDLSDFWRETFAERQNFPAFDDMLVMRRRGFTYGIGETTASGDPDAERLWAHAAHRVVMQSAPEIDLARFPDSPVGSPVSFDFGGVRLTGSAVINALTSHRIISLCQRQGLAQRPLHVLEIGAGYGQGALQLHEQLPVASYTICDLPENLFLSAFYLQANLPDRSCAFIGPGDDKSADLTFVVPPFLNSVHGPFDLVVNAYSFQEMNLQSVEEYWKYVSENLAPDGVFYSLNAHGKAGVVSPDQYPVELFATWGFGPVRRYPFQLFATEPYELVLRSDGASHRAQPSVPKRQIGALARALQLGFNGELAPLCANTVHGRVTDAERAWLDDLVSLTHTGDVNDKLGAATRLRTHRLLPAVEDLFAAAVLFARAQWSDSVPLLQSGCEGLEPSAAKLRGLAMLAAASRAQREQYVAEAISLAPHLEEELRRFTAERHAFAAQVSIVLGLPPVRSASRVIAAARSSASRLISSKR